MVNYKMKAETGVYKLRLNLTKLIHKRPGFKRFLKMVLVGFSNSINKVKHPEGVIISRVIDREHNQYSEEVKDIATGEVTRSVTEPLSQHFSRGNKPH